MSTSRLFEPLQLGHCKLKHRMVMAPLTRFRATADHVPGPYVKTYYEQRASVPGTLIVSEATYVSPRAGGYNNIPGIWSNEQVAAWKQIVDAVHAKGSFIYLQLWNLGRTAEEKTLHEAGYPVMSSSDLAISPKHPKPKAMSLEDVQTTIQDYANGARNAIKAGFDGVEIHGANGYLIDQFTHEFANNRTDAYGGSVENRARFGLDVAKAVIDAVGGDSKKVAIRLSPFFDGQGLKPTPNSFAQYSYLINELKKLDLAYLHLVEPRVGGKTAIDAVYTADTVTNQNDKYIELWGTKAPILIAGGFDSKKAKSVIDEIYTAENVCVAFGRYFISTPDLPFRVQNGIDLNPYDRSTFYTKGEEGYTTYPFSKEFLGQQSRL